MEKITHVFNVKIFKMTNNLKLSVLKYQLPEIALSLFSLYYLISFSPLSLIKISKELLFANYQNKEILDFSFSLIITILFYLLCFLYSKRKNQIQRFVLFVILYDLFEVYKNSSQNYYFELIYIALITFFLFGLQLRIKSLRNTKFKNWSNYGLILLIVFFKTPPFTTGWAPSEWFKVARGYFGLYVGRNENSAFMTPNSSRTFLYDSITGGLVNLFGLEIGYIFIKSASIVLVAFGIYRLFKSLNMTLSQQIIAVSIFVLNQDLIGGNEIIGIFEEDRFAVSFALIALSFWLENDLRKFSIYILFSIFTHIQIGLFWFGFVTLFELISKNKNFIKSFKIVFLLSLPVIIPTGYEFLFGANEIVYAFNKPSSWVYAFIFQAFHVAPFEVDGIIYNDFLLRNWANGFNNIFVFSLISLYLIRVVKNNKLNYFLYFFVIYFPGSIFLHFIDSKLSNPGQLANLFLFRHDTVFYLVILSLITLIFKEELDLPKASIFLILVFFGLTNIYSSQTLKYNNLDLQVQKTEEKLLEINPKFILIEPSKELYTGSIELRTGIPTYVSQKYITNSLANFPDWYEKLEKRGRFFQGECDLFYDMNLEFFIGRENNTTKCGELLFPNGDYSIFKVPKRIGFSLPPFNSFCEYSLEDAENLVNEQKLKYGLEFKIKIIYEESTLDCEGKVIGTNLEQGSFIDKYVNEVVLVVDK